MSLKGRIGHGNVPWASRDWDPQIKCRVSYCPMNKRGKCEIPDQIDIRPDGICQKAIDFKP
jgi:hypothetical protein